MIRIIASSFERVEDLVEAGGYAVLFGLLFACGLGLPLPEDIPLIVAGALCATGKMHLLPAAIFAWSGIIGGDIVLYMLGKKFGLNITKVPFVGKHLTKKRIERVEKLFDRYGVGVIAIGRLFAGIRGAMVVAAGAIRFSFFKFIITDGLAAIVSGGFFVAVGYWLGQNLNEQNIKRFKHWFILGGTAVALIFALWILWKRRHREQVQKVEERVVEKVGDAQKKVAEVVHHTAGRVVEHVKHVHPPQPPGEQQHERS